MLIEEFDSVTWETPRKAAYARKLRRLQLEEQGYEVDLLTVVYGLSRENRGYRLIAHKPGEIKMVTPEHVQRELQFKRDRGTLQRIANFYLSPSSVIFEDLEKATTREDLEGCGRFIQEAVTEGYQAGKEDYSVYEGKMSEAEYREVSAMIFEASVTSRKEES